MFYLFYCPVSFEELLDIFHVRRESEISEEQTTCVEYSLSREIRCRSFGLWANSRFSRSHLSALNVVDIGNLQHYP